MSGDQVTIEARFAFVESQSSTEIDSGSLRVVEVFKGSERKCGRRRVLGGANGPSEVAVAVHVVSAPPSSVPNQTSPEGTSVSGVGYAFASAVR